ncbi:hypothetical protein DM02DRAFT_557197 [Periconia macrospinosa]|uniref:Sld7 C-terminal domain-containing protein n=1 Tax=Periconia macrospinosa TaxID=97972 RepID=A0A2V1E377_9PLEO|nr:hypothetical protein DM02DRAFT_557197 [Periconia macrospinosa]
MTDIWSGAILLPDNQIIKDIGFASQNTASAPVITTTSLRFLATVDTARIPLYLAAGPSLDVWTTSEETQAWFASILLSKLSAASGAPAEDARREWWEHARTQSPVGILVGVSEEVLEGEERTNGSRVTEILLYGTIATPAKRILPTPPSSSPENPYGQDEQLPELRVHALPLSSDLLHRNPVPEFPDTPGAQSEIQAQFISTSHIDDVTPTSPKRKRDVFDEAAQRRKKARAKGGEGVAAAAARAHDTQKPYLHRKSLSIETKGIPLSDSRPNSAHGAHPSPRLLSRSPSLSSDTRPSSRKGAPDGQSKRSNLSHVATIPTQPEEPTTESRNKEALSRVVMAAMRMHGLQQRKKPKSRRGSVAPGVEQDQLTEEAAAEEAAKDEEYKLIYHQTYKSAALALRKHITTKPLHTQPDRLGDVVERLLAIFCTDPLAQPLPGDILVDPLATPGSKDKLGVPNSVHNRTSPFDMPSASRVKPTGVSSLQMNNGSPVSRRDEVAPR